MNEEKVINAKKWQNINVWKRGLAMLLFGFIAGFARFIITMIALFQFISLLFTAKANVTLVEFGQCLNTYIYQINQFLTINTNIYPFPFADWPSGTPNATEQPQDNEESLAQDFDNNQDTDKGTDKDTDKDTNEV